MKSNIIAINSSGDGFRDAHLETERMTAGLPAEQSLCLCLITEEMLSLFNSVAGSISNAEFWLENEDGLYSLHLTAQQKLGNVQREELVKSSTSGKNDAYKGFLGTLKEIFVQALSVGKDIDQYYSSTAYSSQAADLTDDVISTPKWDQFERSVLLSLADLVRISVKGGVVDLIVTKKF